MANEENGNGGKWKKTLGSVGLVLVTVVVVCVSSNRKRRALHRLIEMFQEDPLTAIGILVAAAIITVCVYLFRNRRK